MSQSPADYVEECPECGALLRSSVQNVGTVRKPYYLWLLDKCTNPECGLGPEPVIGPP
jgi:hypothetical protein